jgi:hypothetical protein
MLNAKGNHVCIVLTNKICSTIPYLCSHLFDTYTNSSFSLMLLNKSNDTIQAAKALVKACPMLEKNMFFSTTINQKGSIDRMFNDIYLALSKYVIEETIHIICDVSRTIKTSSRIIRYMYGLWDSGELPVLMNKTLTANQTNCNQFRSTVLYKNDVFSLMDDDILELFKKISRKVVLADISRYYMMWKLGGFYLDLDVFVQKDLIHIVDACISSNQKIILFTEHDNCNPASMGPRENKAHTKRLYNCMFWSLPEQSFWKRCIELAIQRCLLLIDEGNKWTDEDILWASGPDVVTTIYNDEYKSDPSIKVYDNTRSNQYLIHKNGGSWRNNKDCI